MTVRFPVKVDHSPEKGHYGLFDAHGYWVSFGTGGLEMSSLKFMERVAKAVNGAYEQGRADAQRAIREAIGAKGEDDE